MRLSLSRPCMRRRVTNCEEIGTVTTWKKGDTDVLQRLSGRQIPTEDCCSVANTDFLQAVSLFHTRDRRRAAEKSGKQGKELPAVIGNRQALLDLPLDAYKKYETQVEHGFVQAAKFLHMLHIYRILICPISRRSCRWRRFLPTSVMRGSTKRTGRCWLDGTGMVFSVSFTGSAVETRIARDFMEVPVWLKGGPEPSTVSETMFRADRLKTMRMRLSAAYKV